VAEEPRDEAAQKALVADDHAIVREGLAGILRDEGYVVFEASDGEGAVEMASSVRPELVIMDVLMPGMSGIDATERIVALDPSAKVVMLSVADSTETVRAAMRAGAVGYLTKAAASRDVLLDAVRRISVGERVFAPAGLLDALVHHSARLPPSESSPLTAREKEIVALAAQGAASSSIAQALALSPRTVENHLGRVYKKLGISSRVQLARVAADRQIDPNPWVGQACTIMVADIVAYSAPVRSTRDQVILREALFGILREAFTRSGVPWSAIQVQDRGDGVLIVVPPGVPTSTVIDPCLSALTESLRKHNRAVAEPVRMQLRVALDVGPVTSDDLGFSGEAVIRTSRLIDAPVFKEGLQSSNADLGVIVSESIYDGVIRQGNLSLQPVGLQGVHIQVKDWEATAWMWLSRPAPGEIPVSAAAHHIREGSHQAPGGITLWGAPGSGKTTFLGALNIALNRKPYGFTMTGTTEASVDLMIEMTDRLANKREFPHATQAIDHFEWVLYGTRPEPPASVPAAPASGKPLRIPLKLTDPSGELMRTKNLRDPDRKNLISDLADSNGILFMFDPIREWEQGDAFETTNGLLLELMSAVARKNPDKFDGRLPHYVAVCVTKFDEPRVLKSAARLGLLKRDPRDTFQFPQVDDHDARKLFTTLSSISGDGGQLLLRSLDQYFHHNRVRFFVTSAVGFYVNPQDNRFDEDDPQNLIKTGPDESQVRAAIRPINVVEPVLWLGKMVTESEN
jgi:DNA-binding NarL/FixJ family response regulator/class 3 adenylate cyclase